MAGQVVVEDVEQEEHEETDVANRAHAFRQPRQDDLQLFDVVEQLEHAEEAQQP